ncbi:hypothetical protein ATCC90586_011161 [Pythium insidiosum]|nr:hypothetical protein ATCC90586_011161 [Pythium insidiosum]
MGDMHAEAVHGGAHETAQAVADGEPKTVSLKVYCGIYVLVFFYPLDFTFVAEAFSQIGCEVLGCSTDSKFWHLAWINTPRKKGGLGEMQNMLIADDNKEIARAYNVVWVLSLGETPFLRQTDSEGEGERERRE